VVLRLPPLYDNGGDGGGPITPTPTEITEPPFTGRLTINGAVTTPFTTTTAGSVTAILSAIEPNAVIGLALGTWNGTSCQWIVANDNVGVGSGIAGLANGAGNLCARVYDVGKLTEAVDFTVTIKHY
jgi:hypothetical protein